jgi:hypothetical protein
VNVVVPCEQIGRRCIPVGVWLLNECKNHKVILRGRKRGGRKRGETYSSEVNGENVIVVGGTVWFGEINPING